MGCGASDMFGPEGPLYIGPLYTEALSSGQHQVVNAQFSMDLPEARIVSVDSDHTSISNSESLKTETAARTGVEQEWSSSSGTGLRVPENSEEIIKAALYGDTLVEYPLTAKIVRIFTSSTFTDTKVERNSLMEKVYPKLRTFCQELDYDFQVVDMRWGVRDEATDDHMTSELCMNEITECKRLSTGPNFITFLAQKYGYRPFPPKIQEEEFEKILSCVDIEEDSTLLKNWFIKDENSVPPIYQLQPIRSKLIFYADNSDKDKQKQDRDAWWVAFERMQVVLRQAASKALSKRSDIHKYYWSVTEEEIYKGILQARDTNHGCYWFKRSIHGLAENAKDKMARRFMDIAGSGMDEEALTLLSTLRNEMIPKALPSGNIKEYDVGWTEKGIDLSASPEHVTYIEKFCEDFEDVLKGMVTEGIRLRGDRDIEDHLVLECIQHLQFAQAKCKLFHGRETFLQLIKERIHERKPLVLCGEPGCGKTSLMAKLTSLMTSWYPGCNVISRFLGTTSNSSNTKDLLLSICEQIDRMNGNEKQATENMKGIQEYFMKLLKTLNHPLCIILDSLDQLNDLGGRLREWIPSDLNQNIVLILSVIPSEEFKIIPQLRKLLPDKCFLDVPKMLSSDISLILEEWFKREQRHLQVKQKTLVEESCNNVTLPLYIKLTFDQAVTWKSYTQVDDIQLGQTVQETIHNLLDRVEKYHGKVLVKRALAYLTASKNGLSINEIEDILSLDDVALSDIYQYHLPPLRRLPPLLWVRIQADIKAYLINSGADGVQVIRWYHRQFQTVATERYLEDQDFKKEIHGIMIEYFLGKWSGGVLKPYVDKKGNSGEADRFVAAQPLLIKEDGDNSIYNLRKMSELPYHLALTKQMDLLKQHTLLNFDFIYQKIIATSLDIVLDDFNFTLSLSPDEEVEIVRDCLMLSKDALKMEIKQLPGQLLGRLMAEDTTNMPAVQHLMGQSSRPNFDCLLTSQGHLQTSGGPLVAKLAGHDEKIHSFEINKKGTKLISCSSDYTMKLWDIKSGKVLESFDLREHPNLHPWNIIAVRFCNNEKWVILTETSWLYIWNLESGQCEQYIDSVPTHTRELSLNLHLWEEKNLLFAVVDKDMIVFDIITEKQLSTIKWYEEGPTPADQVLKMRGKDFVGGFNNYMVAYRKWTGVVHISDFANFPQCSEKTLSVISEETKSDEFVLMSMTSGGLLGCYHLVPQKQVPGKMPDPVIATFDVYDVRTAKKVHTFPDITHHFFMGGCEILVAMGPESFAFTTHPSGGTRVQLCDVRYKTIQEVLTFSYAPIQLAVGHDNMLFICFNDDLTTIVAYDVSKALEATSGDNKDVVLNPECTEIKALLPGSSRYVHSCTTQGEHAIWDLARRRFVRQAKTSFYSRGGTFMSVTQMAGNEAGEDKVIHVDLKEGKSLHYKAGVCSVPDSHGGVQKVDEHRIAFIGPKSHQVSVYNIQSYKIEYTLDGPLDAKLCCLIASDNGEVAVVGKVLDMEATSASVHEMKPRHIYAFDLKAKKRLSDLVIESLVDFHTSQLERSSTMTSLLTPDGKYLICIISHHAGGSHVILSVHTGEAKNVPTFDGTFIHCFGYCRALDGVISGDSFGTLRVWNPSSLGLISKVQATENKVDVSLMVPSHHSPLVAVRSSQNMNFLIICDLRSQTVLMRYRSETGIASCLFTPEDRFLLLAARSRPGLVQLCLHQTKILANIPEGTTAEQYFLKLIETEEKDIFGKAKKIDFV